MSEEQEQLPDWLLSMRGQSLDEPPVRQPEVELPPLKSPPLQEERAVPSAESLFESLAEEPEAAQEPVEQPESDMVDLLRDMVQPEEGYDEYGYREESKVSGVIPGMKPWQSLVLAVLFFLDVAVCGCMALAMLGRIGF
ncbi:MAG: hypothetical protein JXA14_13115 [Anaerolineae bacterium]|nr:hypothetical protein [Anaerolineae bacterium]